MLLPLLAGIGEFFVVLDPHPPSDRNVFVEITAEHAQFVSLQRTTRHGGRVHADLMTVYRPKQRRFLPVQGIRHVATRFDSLELDCGTRTARSGGGSLIPEDIGSGLVRFPADPTTPGVRPEYRRAFAYFCLGKRPVVRRQYHDLRSAVDAALIRFGEQTRER